MNKIRKMYEMVDAFHEGGGAGNVKKNDTVRLAEDVKAMMDNTKLILNEAEHPLVNNNYSGTDEEKVNSRVSAINKALNDMIEPLNTINSKLDEIREGYDLRING